jgi:uncharacterized membrane protein
MRRIGFVPAVTALLTTGMTGAVVLMGPKPTAAVKSEVLNVPSIALAEPTDKVVLVGWWLIAIVMGFVTVWLVKRHRVERRLQPSMLYSCAATVLGAGSVGLVVASITWGRDDTRAWPGINALGLLVGFGFALFTFQTWRFPRWLAVASTLSVACLVLAYALPALLQTPGSIRDPYDFLFTSDEISAVAASRFPLSDYIPQYSVLLGFPIAPVIRMLAGNAIFGVVAWLLFLQVVALTVAVALPVLVGGWRMLAPALVVAVFPTLAVLNGGTSATTYFAVTPMRIVLPALTLLAAFLVLRNRRELGGFQYGWMLLLGIMAGIAILNNPDYGLPSAVTVFVVSVIVSRTFRERAYSAMILFAGMCGPFLAYSIFGWALGRAVNWSRWLIFQRLFGAEGVNSIAMKPFGLHIAFVTLFISAAVIGFSLLVTSRPAHSSFGYRQGLLLALVGGWSLLSLPYFAGRSLTPTLIGGFSFMAGMVVAAFLPLLNATSRGLHKGGGKVSLESAIALSMGALAIAGAASTFMLVRAPSEYLSIAASKPLGNFGVLDEQTAVLKRILKSPRGSELGLLVGEGRVQQTLSMASLTSFKVGIPSGSVVTNPSYYEFSSVFTKAQCALSWPNGVDYLFVEELTAKLLEKEPSCASHFNFAAMRTYIDGQSRFVLLPREPHY